MKQLKELKLPIGAVLNGKRLIDYDEMVESFEEDMKEYQESLEQGKDVSVVIAYIKYKGEKE